MMLSKATGNNTIVFQGYLVDKETPAGEAVVEIPMAVCAEPFIEIWAKREG
ncbi:MAG: hypothetical protein ACRDSH_17050 [Pseudonocardiaceae bacterium]